MGALSRVADCGSDSEPRPALDGRCGTGGGRDSGSHPRCCCGLGLVTCHSADDIRSARCRLGGRRVCAAGRQVSAVRLLKFLQLAGGGRFHHRFGGRSVSGAVAAARGASCLAAGRPVAGRLAGQRAGSRAERNTRWLAAIDTGRRAEGRFGRKRDRRGVTNDGSYHLFVSTRAFAATSFTEAPTPVMSSVFLDDDGGRARRRSEWSRRPDVRRRVDAVPIHAGARRIVTVRRPHADRGELQRRRVAGFERHRTGGARLLRRKRVQRCDPLAGRCIRRAGRHHRRGDPVARDERRRCGGRRQRGHAGERHQPPPRVAELLLQPARVHGSRQARARGPPPASSVAPTATASPIRRLRAAPEAGSMSPGRSTRDQTPRCAGRPTPTTSTPEPWAARCFRSTPKRRRHTRHSRTRPRTETATPAAMPR